LKKQTDKKLPTKKETSLLIGNAV